MFDRESLVEGLKGDWIKVCPMWCIEMPEPSPIWSFSCPLYSFPMCRFEKYAITWLEDPWIWEPRIKTILWVCVHCCNMSWLLLVLLILIISTEESWSQVTEFVANLTNWMWSSKIVATFSFAFAAILVSIATSPSVVVEVWVWSVVEIVVIISICLSVIRILSFDLCTC